MDAAESQVRLAKTELRPSSLNRLALNRLIERQSAGAFASAIQLFAA